MIADLDAMVELEDGQTFDLIPSGVFTIEGPTEHRTFRITRQEPHSAFLPSVRCVALLVGPDEWKRFGRVSDEEPSIRLFYKLRGQRSYESYARMIVRIFHHGARRFIVNGEYRAYRILWQRRCYKCNHVLTTPESIESGYGPTCRESL